jgi:hypothetical protein
MYDPHYNFFGLVASAMAALERCAACPADVAAFLAALGYPPNVAREAARLAGKPRLA